MEAVLDVTGADCPVCIRAIEHAARHIEGVRECRVDAARHEIRVAYNGPASILSGIVDVVHRLGYDATVRAQS